MQKPELCVKAWEEMQGNSGNSEVGDLRIDRDRENVLEGTPSDASTRSGASPFSKLVSLPLMIEAKEG